MFNSAQLQMIQMFGKLWDCCTAARSHITRFIASPRFSRATVQVEGSTATFSGVMLVCFACSILWVTNKKTQKKHETSMIKGSLGGETSVLRTFRMSGKELVKDRVSKERVSQRNS